jgi:hypothetical protein
MKTIILRFTLYHFHVAKNTHYFQLIVCTFVIYITRYILICFQKKLYPEICFWIFFRKGISGAHECRWSARRWFSGSHHPVSSKTSNKMTVLGFLSCLRQRSVRCLPSLIRAVFVHAHPYFFWLFGFRGSVAKFCHHGIRLSVHGEVIYGRWHGNRVYDY